MSALTGELLPGESRPFELIRPFTAEEVVELAGKMRGRRRAALLAYAQQLQRETAVAELVNATRRALAYSDHICDTEHGGTRTPQAAEHYNRMQAALARIGSAA